MSMWHKTSSLIIYTAVSYHAEGVPHEYRWKGYSMGIPGGGGGTPLMEMLGGTP